jgi:hypothetical protein
LSLFDSSIYILWLFFNFYTIYEGTVVVVVVVLVVNELQGLQAVGLYKLDGVAVFVQALTLVPSDT